MNQKINDIEKLIKDKGYRLTINRTKLIELFVTSKKHLRADDAYQLLKKEGVSLPTIYRNIELLKQVGVIKEINLENERYYELDLYSGKKMHIHFKCNECGIIKEYDSLEVKRMMLEQRDYLEEQFEDLIEDITIVMQGKCQHCKS